MAGRIMRGDIRLYPFPAPDKKRPVVVLTHDSFLSFLSTATVAPITSTVRGVPSEVLLTEHDGMKATCAVNLQNMLTVSQRHFGKRVGHLNAARMKEICSALNFALGCTREEERPI